MQSTFYPTRILLLSPDTKSTRDFYLTHKANTPVAAAYFKVFDPGKPWKIERNPGGQAPANANALPPRRMLDGPAAQRQRARRRRSAALTTPVNRSGRNQGRTVAMPRLKANLIAPFVILIGTGFAAARDKERGAERPEAPKSKANGPAAPRNPASIERLLSEWESRSARLRTLEFSFYRIDRDQNLNEQHYEGHAAFKHPNLAYLDSRKVKLVPDNDEKTTKMVPKLDASKKRLSTPLETLIWTDKERWQYHYDTKHVSIFRLDEYPHGALEDAQYPLVFNVKAAEARERFEMTLQV